MVSNYAEALRLWHGKPYYSLNQYLQEHFGEKIYKIALDGGFTCPNRDGTLGNRGCIFCSAGGSGDFSGARLSNPYRAEPDEARPPAGHVLRDARLGNPYRAELDEARPPVGHVLRDARMGNPYRAEIFPDIHLQLEAGKNLLSEKYTGRRFIAYFQAFTNTYAPVEHLEKIYMSALSHPETAVLSIATRPDCLSPDIIGLLKRLNNIKPVWIELGLQTIHEDTARFIRRGYSLDVFTDALCRLKEAGIDTIVHTILGLPGESEDDILETHRFLAQQPIQGIKLQLLHVLRGTDLDTLYHRHPFHILTLEEYTDLIIRCIEILPPEMVIHRITGDGPKNLLTAPLWSGQKKQVLNTIHHTFKTRATWQGRLYTPL